MKQLRRKAMLTPLKSVSAIANIQILIKGVANGRTVNTHLNFKD